MTSVNVATVRPYNAPSMKVIFVTQIIFGYIWMHRLYLSQTPPPPKVPFESVDVVEIPYGDIDLKVRPLNP